MSFINSTLALMYWRLFVIREAYTVQSRRPDSRTGRHYYFQPKDHRTGAPRKLSVDVVRNHLEGGITVGFYALNPATQRCKWLAIDADHADAIDDLLRIQYRLSSDGVESALEMSRRGGHLWIFFAAPVLAKQCRRFIQEVSQSLDIRIRSGTREGIELFPKQDILSKEEFGSAIRGPLGIHRAAGRRFWFYGAEHAIAAQIEYLNSLRKVTERELESFVSKNKKESHGCLRYRGNYTDAFRPEFYILEYIKVVRKKGRNYVARCPSCAQFGHDRSRDNLSILVANPRFYKCWAGCSKDMIRAALGRPIAAYR
jgi:hypothetical protein